MKWTILACALLVSCSGTVAPPIETPKEQPPAKPAVERIVVPLDRADKNAQKIRRELDAALAELAESRRSAEEFNAQIESMKSKGLSVQEELDLVWNELTKTRDRNMFLEERLVTVVADTETLEANLEAAQKATTKALTDVALKDAEAEELRGKLEKANKAIPELTKERDKALMDAENAKVYKTWVLGGIAVLAGGWLLREILPRLLRGGL